MARSSSVCRHKPSHAASIASSKVKGEAAATEAVEGVLLQNGSGRQLGQHAPQPSVGSNLLRRFIQILAIVEARLLLRVHQNFVSVSDLFEFLLSRRLLLGVGLLVGVVHQRQLAVRFLDLLLGCRFVYAEDLVVVLPLAHLQQLGSVAVALVCLVIVAFRVFGALVSTNSIVELLQLHVRFADGAVCPSDRLFAAVLLAEACNITTLHRMVEAAGGGDAVEWGHHLPLRCSA